MENKNFITNSKEETERLAEEIAKEVESGNVLVFYGELGSGKTTFIQALAKALGIKRRIISPSFIIVRHYMINQENSFYHIDLYRTNSKNDLIGLGIDQILEDEANIVAVEWGEKLLDLMPKKRIELKFKIEGENKRKISVTNYE